MEAFIFCICMCLYNAILLVFKCKIIQQSIDIEVFNDIHIEWGLNTNINPIYILASLPSIGYRTIKQNTVNNLDNEVYDPFLFSHTAKKWGREVESYHSAKKHYICISQLPSSALLLINIVALNRAIMSGAIQLVR